MNTYEIIYRFGLLHQAKTHIKANSLNEAKELAKKYGYILSIVDVTYKGY